MNRLGYYCLQEIIKFNSETESSAFKYGARRSGGEGEAVYISY